MKTQALRTKNIHTHKAKIFNLNPQLQCLTLANTTWNLESEHFPQSYAQLLWITKRKCHLRMCTPVASLIHALYEKKARQCLAFFILHFVPTRLLNGRTFSALDTQVRVKLIFRKILNRSWIETNINGCFEVRKVNFISFQANLCQFIRQTAG